MSKSTDEMKKKIRPASLWRKPWFYLAIVFVVALLALAAIQIPAVNTRVRSLYSTIYYRLNPPTENVFGPSQQGTISADVFATLTAMAPTATIETPAAIAQETDVVQETPAPTSTPFPDPASFVLEGMGL